MWNFCDSPEFQIVCVVTFAVLLIDLSSFYLFSHSCLDSIYSRIILRQRGIIAYKIAKIHIGVCKSNIGIKEISDDFCFDLFFLILIRRQIIEGINTILEQSIVFDL